LVHSGWYFLGRALSYLTISQADLWGGPQSAINAVSGTETAFSRRSALYTFQFYASSDNSAPPYPTDGIPFVDGMVNSITTEMSGTNFAMYDCYVECVHFLWYGPNVDQLLTYYVAPS
jgi:hypothetical protein